MVPTPGRRGDQAPRPLRLLAQPGAARCRQVTCASTSTTPWATTTSSSIRPTIPPGSDPSDGPDPRHLPPQFRGGIRRDPLGPAARPRRRISACASSTPTAPRRRSRATGCGSSRATCGTRSGWKAEPSRSRPPAASSARRSRMRAGLITIAMGSVSFDSAPDSRHRPGARGHRRADRDRRAHVHLLRRHDRQSPLRHPGRRTVPGARPALRARTSRSIPFSRTGPTSSSCG